MMAPEDDMDRALAHVFNNCDQLSPDVEALRNVLCSRTLLATARLRGLCEAAQSPNALEDDVIEGIQPCVEDMIRFAKAAVSGLFDRSGDDHYLLCLVSIFDPGMMSCLLHLRQSLLGPANKELETFDSNENSDGVVTWVDVLLALLGEMVLEVAGGASASDTTTAISLPAGLQTQKQEENIRTASQLPSSFRLLPDVLRSHQCSPSLKRLSLSFLFAALVIRPDLTECSPWVEAELNPSRFSECLESLIGDYSVQAQTMSAPDTYFADTTSQTHRSAFSMLLALYSAANMPVQDRSPAPFRPHTEAQLLVLTRAVLSFGDPKNGLVVPELDHCHRLLFRWGCFVPWSWSAWDDPRLLQFEQKALTATWLCHLEATFLSAREQIAMEPCELGPDAQAILKAAAAINPVALFIALSSQVKHTIDGLKGEPSNSQGQENSNSEVMRLFRVTWCLAYLVSEHSSALPSSELGIVSERLLGLYGSLEGRASGTKVKAEIVRCLTYMEKETVQKSCSAHDARGESVRDSFTGGLANSIGRALRSEKALVSDEDAQLALVVLLDTISLLCKCNVTDCLPTPTSSLLAKLVKELSSAPASRIQIRASLLTCLASARKSNSSSSGPRGAGLASLPKSCTDEAIFNLAFGVRGTHLTLASALASYAAVSVRKSTDGLLVAETWDYLCDTLLFTVAHQRTAEHTALAIEEICEGLAALLTRSDAKISAYLLSSPLTLSFVTTLKQLPSADVDRSKAFEGLFEKMHRLCTTKRN